MIRLKHRHYPVWITWEGDTETFDKVKNFLLEDIRDVGFAGFDAMSDVRAFEDKPVIEPGSEEDWDNHIASKSTNDTNKSSSNNDKSKKSSTPKKPKGKTLGDSTSNNSFVE